MPVLLPVRIISSTYMRTVKKITIIIALFEEGIVSLRLLKATSDKSSG